MKDHGMTERGTPLQRAVSVAQAPWGRTRPELKRAQTVLREAGCKELARSLQPFVEEPPLPLGPRRGSPLGRLT